MNINLFYDTLIEVDDIEKMINFRVPRNYNVEAANQTQRDIDEESQYLT